MRRWVLGVVCVGLLGCSTYHPPAGVPVAQEQRDEVECRALAEQGAGPTGLLFREVRKGDLLAKCLASRGWVKESPQ